MTVESSASAGDALYGPYYQENGACPYLPDREWGSMFFVAEQMPEPLFARLLEMGFRRSGRSMYAPTCRGCRECVSIRVPVAEFVPTRDQRRSLKKNPDVSLAVEPTSYSDEKFELYRAFLDARYPGRERVTARGFRAFFVDHFGNTREFQYRAGGRLLAVGMVDLAPRAASSVYFYFDPREGRRSLGTYSVLREIAYCRETRRDYLYLGFRVAGCRAMEYKSRFRPHELLCPLRGWVREEEWERSGSQS